MLRLGAEALGGLLPLPEPPGRDREGDVLLAAAAAALGQEQGDPIADADAGPVQFPPLPQTTSVPPSCSVARSANSRSALMRSAGE